MSEDTTRTDIVPGLRPSDTPPLGLPVPEGRHRARRGAPIPRPALIAVFGAPTAVVMLAVGLSLPGWLAGGDEHAPVRVSPSPTAADPSSLDPVMQPPVPTRSRADRSRPRGTRPPALAPSSPAARRSSSPTPTRATPTPRPSSPPVSPSPTGPGSSSTPTPSTTVTLLPPPEVSG